MTKNRISSTTTSRYLICLCFFFQAEDGIRDRTVTGVQTCALPISRSWVIGRGGAWLWSFIRIAAASGCPIQIGRNLFPSAVLSRTIGCLPTKSKLRSEERRVGKELGAGWGRWAGRQEEQIAWG